MLLQKTSGCLAHGQGISDSTLTKWVDATPRCALICNVFEEFCGVHSRASDQHVDLCACCTARDVKDYGTLVNWLLVHSPFSYQGHDALVSNSNGVVADKAVNVDKIYAVRKTAAEVMTDHNYTDIKIEVERQTLPPSAVQN